MADQPLSELEQDLLDMCFDLNGGPRAILIKWHSETDPIDRDQALTGLADRGLLRRT